MTEARHAVPANGETQRTLYGHVSGRWAMLETPVGVVTPPTMTLHVPLSGSVELTHLGAPVAAMRRLAGELRTWGSDGDPSRAGLVLAVDLVAQVLGVNKATSARWLSDKISATRVIHPPAQGWSRLVVALLSPRQGVLRAAPGWRLLDEQTDGRWFAVAALDSAIADLVEPPELPSPGRLTAVERFEMHASGALARVYLASLAEASV